MFEQQHTGGEWKKSEEKISQKRNKLSFGRISLHKEELVACPVIYPETKHSLHRPPGFVPYSGARYIYDFVSNLLTSNAPVGFLTNGKVPRVN